MQSTRVRGHGRSTRRRGRNPFRFESYIRLLGDRHYSALCFVPRENRGIDDSEREPQWRSVGWLASSQSRPATYPFRALISMPFIDVVTSIFRKVPSYAVFVDM